ncbi:MAG: peptidylprolyl isomerase [Gammaproteobacteria bacterium]|nr:peptidylprolyl isomerase [Gammaproteobacteria bacterium]MDQ7074115.1 peptidylprolyl isomerase [Gammaproteobacteria bacterium]
MAEQRIGINKFVEFTYQITDDLGEVVEKMDFPLNYIHGHGSGMHDKVEAQMKGKQAGDKVTVMLEPDEAFGQPDPELMFEDDVDNVPEEFRYVGAEAMFENSNGESKKFVVSKVENGKITLDANHPLAGKTVVFRVEIKTVRDATREELSGKVATGRESGEQYGFSDNGADKRTLN